MVSVPTVLRAIAIVDFALVKRGIGFLEKIFHQVHGIVEIEIVHVATVDMYLPLEFGTERRPVALQDVAEVVVLFPILGNFRIDIARQFIEDACRISIGTLRGVNGFPNVPLSTGTAVCSKRQLQVIALFNRARELP